MCDALVRHGYEHTTVRWIRATDSRVVVVALNETSMRVAISKGRPQGWMLSPLLRYLAVNILIPGSVEVVFLFKDTLMTCLLAVDKFPNTVSGLIQWALSTV
jgi:hypothetical protein